MTVKMWVYSIFIDFHKLFDVTLLVLFFIRLQFLNMANNRLCQIRVLIFNGFLLKFRSMTDLDILVHCNNLFFLIETYILWLFGRP